MKSFYLIPLLFLSACSTTPKLALHPQPPSPAADTVRYPEVVRAYHFGRYVDPNDDLVMHEQHVVYRVEENTRWDLHPPVIANETRFPQVQSQRDAAFNPVPVNDAVLAEVNAQKLATIQIIMQTRTLTAALAQFQMALSQTKTNLQETAKLHATVNDIERRLDALAAARAQSPAAPISTTNEPPDSLDP